MKIAFASSEVYPFAKTGGLADVSYSLPKTLAKAGHNVCIFMPGYSSIDKAKYGLKLALAPLIIKFGPDDKYAAILESTYIPGVKTYFIDYDKYFDRDNIYGDQSETYRDNAERFDFFAKAVILALKKINFMPDIIHCNDWHTGLIPAYLKTIYRKDSFFRETGTVITVHNAGYQGIFSGKHLALNDYYNKEFIKHNADNNDTMNYLTEGVNHSDIITTVSKKYSEEIQTQEYGLNMARVFKKNKKRLFAVPNAVDYENWNPETDTHLPCTYSIDNIAAKIQCKLELQKQMGLPVNADIPLLGTISRIVFQKGVDILAETLELLLQDEKFQFIISGSGDLNIWRKYESLKKMFPESIGLNRGYSEELEHLSYAGLDILLMPSRYEPCGLTQMYSLKYGTVPIVRATGGLDDVIEEWDDIRHTGNGFKFTNLINEEIYTTTRKVIKIYKDKKSWELIRKNGMNFDYSWNDAVIEYEKIYKLALLPLQH